MTLFPTIEAFPLELLLLRDSPFRPQITAFPSVVGFLELGTLTMLHKVSLSLAQIVCPFLLRSLIVFFNAKSNNQIFDAYLLSLMLKIILEVFPSRRQLLCNTRNYTLIVLCKVKKITICRRYIVDISYVGQLRYETHHRLSFEGKIG